MFGLSIIVPHNQELTPMADSPEVKDAPQSGAKVGIGIILFIVGLFAILWIVKAVFGM